MAKQNLAKKVVLMYEGKPVKALIIEPNHQYYRIHVPTHKVEQIELQYDMTAVNFDTEYHYLQALSSEKALEKFIKFQKNEANKQSRTNKVN
jgi:hypothetical protein